MKLQSVQELARLRESAREEVGRRERCGTVVAVGMGTCGIAAGARETLAALQVELEKQGIEATLTTVGCLGLCAREPLVEIRQAGVSRVLYGNLTAERTGQLVAEHLVSGRAVKEWVVGRMEDSG